jgi:hypothetical protein
VTQPNQCAAIAVGEADLDVVNDRIGHEQRSGDLKQRWPVDRLNATPVVSVIVAQVSEPATPRSRLEREWKRCAIARFIGGPQLFEQRSEGH